MHATPTDKPVAIVTGAGSGIGAATARLLAERGMVVVLAGRREGKLAGVAREIEAAGGEPLGVPADVSKRETPRESVEQELSRLERIEGVLNDAVVRWGSR